MYNECMTEAKEKIAAYDYLISQGLISKDFLEKSERDFATGDIFLCGVPAGPMDATRALDGLSSRIDAAVDARTMTLKHSSSCGEIASLEEMNAMLMVLPIPSVLGWHVADGYKGKFAALLGSVWHKRNGWLARRIKQRERLETVSPALIAAYLLDASLDEFELKHMPYAAALDKWLAGKVEWQIKKETREPSLDVTISDPDSEGKETTLTEVMPDSNAHNEIVEAADRKLVLEKLVNILPNAEKAAVTKSRLGEELSRTEQRAMNRGIRKMREFVQKHGVEFPL